MLVEEPSWVTSLVACYRSLTDEARSVVRYVTD